MKLLGFILFGVVVASGPGPAARGLVCAGSPLLPGQDFCPAALRAALVPLFVLFQGAFRHKGAAILGEMGLGSEVPFAQLGSLPAPRDQCWGGQGPAVQHQSHWGLPPPPQCRGWEDKLPCLGMRDRGGQHCFAVLLSVSSKILLLAQKMLGLSGLCLESCGAGVGTGLCKVRGKYRVSFPKPLGVQSCQKNFLNQTRR